MNYKVYGNIAINLDLVAYAEFSPAKPNATKKYQKRNSVELTFLVPGDSQHLTIFDQDALHLWKLLNG